MSEGKVITRLRDRHTIESALAHMLVAQDDAAWEQEAERIAGLGPEVVSVLMQKLSLVSPSELAALGAVAVHLDPDLVVPALSDLIEQPDTPDVQRMGAILILERYLGEPAPEVAFASLQDPHGVARQSLVSMLEAAQENRFLLLEYLRILLDQPAEATHAVIEALSEIGGGQALALLRLLAQDEEPAIAEQALDALIAFQTPAAFQVAQSLLPTLIPDLSDRAERALRKIRFRGLEITPLPPVPAACRALVTPVDGRGNQMLWLLYQEPAAPRVRFLGLVFNDTLGLQDAFGEEAALPDRFPALGPVGEVHLTRFQDRPILLLEIPYDYGRRLLRQGLAQRFRLGLPTPLEYRALNDQVWDYELPSDLPARMPVVTPAQQRALFPWVGQLLDQIALGGWFLEGELIYTYAERFTHWRHIDSQDPLARRWLMNLVTEYFTPDALSRLQTRLLQMSEWFMWSEDQDTARLAWVAAVTLPRVPPQQHPLVVRMIEIGFAVAAENMRRGFDPRKTPYAFGGQE
ncbi:MAG: hypothetical protein KKA73_13385 [Chloroflexi bacterium]|nr:hypothetical protein [Chloroflexota bacterium]MBU1748675.1 hypothetical protein [Chloroflexota bacterium]